MSEVTSLTVVDKGKGMVTVVSDETIASYLESFGNKLTTFHRSQFIQICKAFQLNPFIREIYGIPYGDKFSIIVGYEVYLKRADRSGLLAGWRAWTEGTGADMKGCVEITRKDWTAPFYHEVFFVEYDQNNSMWKSKGRTMIKKVAIAQGFRMCFPEELGGMPYTADEMPDPINITPQEPKGKPPVQQPQSKSQAPAQEGAINENQKKLLYVKLKQADIADADFCKFYEIEHLTDLPAKNMNEALAMIKDGKIPTSVPVKCAECGEINGHSNSCPNAEPGDE